MKSKLPEPTDKSNSRDDWDQDIAHADEENFRSAVFHARALCGVMEENLWVDIDCATNSCGPRRELFSLAQTQLTALAETINQLARARDGRERECRPSPAPTPAKTLQAHGVVHVDKAELGYDRDDVEIAIMDARDVAALARAAQGKLSCCEGGVPSTSNISREAKYADSLAQKLEACAERLAKGIAATFAL